MNKLAIVVIAICVAGCASRPQAIAEWSTYPHDRVAQVVERVSIVPLAGLKSSEGTVEHRLTEVGDRAEIATWILPRHSGEFSERTLIARVDETGTRLCQRGHRVVGSHYYYSSEATLRFARISSPALRVNYRCALDLTAAGSNPAAKALMEYTSRLSDSRYFDISTQRMKGTAIQVLEAVRHVIASERMPIVDEATHGNFRYLLAGRDPREVRWGRIERLAAVVGDADAGAVLAVRLYAYQLTYHRRGVMDTERPGFAMGPQPWDRKTAFERAMKFIGAVQEELGAKSGR